MDEDDIVIAVFGLGAMDVLDQGLTVGVAGVVQGEVFDVHADLVAGDVGEIGLAGLLLREGELHARALLEGLGGELAQLSGRRILRAIARLQDRRELVGRETRDDLEDSAFGRRARARNDDGEAAIEHRLLGPMDAEERIESAIVFGLGVEERSDGLRADQAGEGRVRVAPAGLAIRTSDQQRLAHDAGETASHRRADRDLRHAVLREDAELVPHRQQHVQDVGEDIRGATQGEGRDHERGARAAGVGVADDSSQGLETLTAVEAGSVAVGAVTVSRL